MTGTVMNIPAYRGFNVVALTHRVGFGPLYDMELSGIRRAIICIYACMCVWVYVQIDSSFYIRGL